MFAQAFAFLIFSVYFCIVIVGMTKDDGETTDSSFMLNSENEREIYPQGHRNMSRSIFDACQWAGLSGAKCNFECSEITIKKINEEIDSFVQNFPLSWCFYDGISLKLIDIGFHDTHLIPGWLAIDFKLTHLKIQSRDIETIAPDSFTGKSLMWVEELTLKNLGISRLLENSLNGLRSLKLLKLDGMPIEVTEQGILAPVAESLESLIIYGLATFEISLYNFTGSCSLPLLRNINIGHSLIGKIENNSLEGLQKLSALYLINCQIDSIAKGSFDHIIDTVKVVDLRQNGLLHVDGAFDRLILKHEIRIYVGSYVWGCYQMTAELQILIQENPEIFPDVHCESIIAQTTTVPSTKTTGITKTIKCMQNMTNEQNTEVLVIDHEEILINITRQVDGSIHIIIDGVTSDYFLLWFDSQPSDYSLICLYNSVPRFTITGLIEGTTYTICVMNKLSTTITPFNCQPYYHELTEVKQDVWLTVNDRAATISVVIVAYLTSTAIGSLVGYCLIRMNPVLLKGGSRVVIVKKISDDSKRTTATDISNDSIYRNAQAPNSMEYVDVCDELKYGYETPSEPSRFDIIKWKLNQKECCENEKSKIYEKCPESPPPPLPPPRKSISERYSTSPTDIVRDENCDENYI